MIAIFYETLDFAIASRAILSWSCLYLLKHAEVRMAP